MKLVKSLAVAIDKKLCDGKIAKSFSNIVVENNLRSHRSELYQFGFDVEYMKNKTSMLNALCEKYGSDKGEITNEGHPYAWSSHTYADVYELLFQLRRHDVRLVLECGLGTNNPAIESSMGVNGRPGASLRVWRDYFPKAKIIGIDIDPDILFEEDRIQTFACDQTSSESIARFIEAAVIDPRSLDIVIDDGLHEFHAGISLFEAVGDYLSADGIYVIEDVGPRYYINYKDYFANSSGFVARFFSLRRPGMAVGDNRMIVITRNAQ